MRSLLAFFTEENPHRILIPRGKLLLLMGLLLLLEALIFLLWQGVFIIISLFFCALFAYLAGFGLTVWRRYYAVLWYPVCLLLSTAGAYGLRILLYSALS